MSEIDYVKTLMAWAIEQNAMELGFFLGWVVSGCGVFLWGGLAGISYVIKAIKGGK